MFREIYNRRVSFDYNIFCRYECGISLLGPEVKSISYHGCNIINSACFIVKNSMYINNLHIPNYRYNFQRKIDETRVRRLLLHKHEIKKILGLVKQEKMFIIPERVFFNKNHLVKVIIAIGKVAKKYDKREKIKEKDDRKNPLY